MVDCATCMRARQKREMHLAEAGLFECMPSDDSNVVFHAFTEFAVQHHVLFPFSVSSGSSREPTAWPLQFSPKHLASCGGFRVAEFSCLIETNGPGWLLSLFERGVRVEKREFSADAESLEGRAEAFLAAREAATQWRNSRPDKSVDPSQPLV